MQLERISLRGCTFSGHYGTHQQYAPLLQESPRSHAMVSRNGQQGHRAQPVSHCACLLMLTCQPCSQQSRSGQQLSPCGLKTYPSMGFTLNRKSIEI